MSKYGSIGVKLNEEVNKDFYDVRSLLISCEEQKRLVQQFHFKTWKDYQIPKHLDELLDFVNTIRRKTKQQDLPPIVVHCRYVLLKVIITIKVLHLCFLVFKHWCGSDRGIYCIVRAVGKSRM